MLSIKTHHTAILNLIQVREISTLMSAISLALLIKLNHEIQLETSDVCVANSPWMK